MPRYDIQLALAQALTYHRYRRRLDERFEASPAATYIKAVCEHSVRIQRLSEGLSAFSTAGTEDEVMWLCRPSLELLASQCLLQFGHVNHPDKRAMTKAEKAEAYYFHGDRAKLGIMKKGVGCTSRAADEPTMKSQILKLEKELKGKPFRYHPGKPWHGMDFGSALRKGVQACEEAVGGLRLESLRRLLPVLKDFMNIGIHGNSFAAGFLYVPMESAQSTLLRDSRSPKHTPESQLPVLIASYSLELLAHEFGERHLIGPMLVSALEDVESWPERFVTHFPTALVPYMQKGL